jgi:hypothetical protein
LGFELVSNDPRGWCDDQTAFPSAILKNTTSTSSNTTTYIWQKKIRVQYFQVFSDQNNSICKSWLSEAGFLSLRIAHRKLQKLDCFNDNKNIFCYKKRPIFYLRILVTYASCFSAAANRPFPTIYLLTRQTFITSTPLPCLRGVVYILTHTLTHTHANFILESSRLESFFFVLKMTSVRKIFAFHILTFVLLQFFLTTIFLVRLTHFCSLSVCNDLSAMCN